MEKCIEVKDARKNLTYDDLKLLKKKLLILHHFKLIHMDIKPMNIMFSEEFNSLVFIDFGFSKIISEELGFKSKSSFLGSINYCSQEMLKIGSNSSKFSLIDLYYNDVHCLDVSINEILELIYNYEDFYSSEKLDLPDDDEF